MANLRDLKKRLERLIESFDAFAALYRDLRNLILAEHDALKAGDLKRVEVVFKEKTSAAQEIEDAFKNMRALIRDMPVEFGDLPQPTWGSLSEIIVWCDDVILKLKQQTISEDGQAAIRVCQGVIDSTRAFLLVAHDVKPLIELNRLLLEKMSSHYSESQRFWLELSKDSASTYNAQGIQKSSTTASVLLVRT